MYALKPEERETIIRFDDAQRVAHIDTAMPTIIAKLDALAAQFPDIYKCVHVDSLYHAKKYAVDARFIRFGKPASEAYKAAHREGIDRINSARQNARKLRASTDLTLNP